MVLVSGAETKLAFRQAVAWTTPIDVGAVAGTVQPFLSESLAQEIALIDDLSLTGIPVMPIGGRGNETVEGSVDFNASYDDRWITWLAMILGSETAAAFAGNADFTRHEIAVVLSTFGKYGTLCVGQGATLDVREYANAKPMSIEFSTSGTDNLLSCTAEFLIHRLNRNFTTTPGAVNIPADLAAATRLTPGTGFEIVLGAFSHMTIGLRNDANTAYDSVCISELSSLLIERPQEGSFTTCFAGRIDEPTTVDFINAGGSFVLPDYSDDATLQRFITLHDSKSPRAFFIRFTTPQTFDPAGGGVGAFPFSLEFIFPATQFTIEGPNAEGPGKMPVTVTFSGKRKADPAAIPVDSQGVVLPASSEGVHVRLINGRSVVYMT